MAQKVPLAEPSGEDEEILCKHHWEIQTATGPVSPGVCLTCGEMREFKNYVEASTWGADRSANKANAATPQKPDKENDEVTGD